MPPLHMYISHYNPSQVEIKRLSILNMQVHTSQVDQNSEYITTSIN
jgi:hypothetical protein